MIAVPDTTTLVRIEDRRYDVAAGWLSIPLDGSPGSSRFSRYGGGEFDAVTVSPNGDVVALTTSTG